MTIKKSRAGCVSLSGYETASFGSEILGIRIFANLTKMCPMECMADCTVAKIRGSGLKMDAKERSALHVKSTE